MPITAETFELGHFDKLVRGIEVASQAFEKLWRDAEDAKRQLDEAASTIHGLEEELSDARTALHDQQRLVEFIRDVDRGVKTMPELLDHLRELEGAYA